MAAPSLFGASCLHPDRRNRTPSKCGRSFLHRVNARIRFFFRNGSAYIAKDSIEHHPYKENPTHLNHQATLSPQVRFPSSNNECTQASKVGRSSQNVVASRSQLIRVPITLTFCAFALTLLTKQEVPAVRPARDLLPSGRL